MDSFEYQLRVLVRYVQQNVNSSAFAMYQPGYITIGYFDNRGQLNVIADTEMMHNIENTFDMLYDQVNRQIRETEHIDIAVEL
jgi:hypothetical protein